LVSKHKKNTFILFIDLNVSLWHTVCVAAENGRSLLIHARSLGSFRLLIKTTLHSYHKIQYSAKGKQLSSEKDFYLEPMQSFLKLNKCNFFNLILSLYPFGSLCSCSASPYHLFALASTAF